jgi:hypothetical protein
LRPRDSPAAPRELAAVEQGKREPERTSGSTLRVTAAQERLMSASQDSLAVGVFPSQIGCVRQAFEVLAW